MLLSWSRRVGLAGADAADLVQEVLAVLIVELPTFDYDPARSFRVWLKTIALNKWREHRRRPPHLSLEDLDLLDRLPAPSAEAALKKEYRYQLIIRTLRAIKHEFQPRTWQVCWEVLVRGRAPAEVAAEFGLTAGALYAAKCRVLKRLRRELVGMVE